MSERLTDIDVERHHQTADAILVSTDGNSDNAVWLPKAACEIVETPGKPHLMTITLPERLATEKGLT